MLDEKSPRSSQPEWTPKQPKVLIEYDAFDLPEDLLFESVLRDKHEADMIHWQPSASGRSAAEALQEFLGKFQNRLLGIGFKRLWYNGDAYSLETGKLAHEKPEIKSVQPEIRYVPTATAVRELSAVLSEITFKDTRFTISVEPKDEVKTHFQGQDTKNQILIISVNHPTFGSKQIHRIEAATSSSGDRWSSTTYSYTFKDADVVQQVKSILQSNPDYSIQ